MFLVTSCEEHGTVECEDRASASFYQDLARDYLASGVFGLIKFDLWSHACCADMRVAETGEEIS